MLDSSLLGLDGLKKLDYLLAQPGKYLLLKIKLC